MSSFPQRLRAARQALGLTQEELGFALGTTKAAVSAWETGRGAPRFGALPGLRDALGQSLDTLLCGQAASVHEPPGGAYPRPALDAREQQLLRRYRALSPKQRQALLAFVKKT